ncbi:fungal pheromone STE3G-protein-coupled receptor, partial [Gloeophyllum trabeum ATCC 11539]
MRPELPIVSFICAVLLSVVLCRQWRSLEVTVLSVFAWLLICNLIHGVNSMINLHFVPIWCDLVTKFELATPFAIASACFCLVRRLEVISSKREMKTSAVWQSRIQTLACLGVPTIYILLSLLVQDHRFDVVQDMGCKAAVFVSAPAIIILWVPILAFCLGTIAYLGIVSARIWRKRADFFLHTTARSRLAGLDFQVLLSMSAVQALLLAYSVISKLALSTVLPWTSLSAVHTDWGQVEFVSTDTMSTCERAELELDWWIVPTLSLVSLVSLAFGASVRIGMRDVAQRVQRHIRR